MSLAAERVLFRCAESHLSLGLRKQSQEEDQRKIEASLVYSVTPVSKQTCLHCRVPRTWEPTQAPF